MRLVDIGAGAECHCGKQRAEQGQPPQANGQMISENLLLSFSSHKKDEEGCARAQTLQRAYRLMSWHSTYVPAVCGVCWPRNVFHRTTKVVRSKQSNDSLAWLTFSYAVHQSLLPCSNLSHEGALRFVPYLPRKPELASGWVTIGSWLPASGAFPPLTPTGWPVACLGYSFSSSYLTWLSEGEKHIKRARQRQPCRIWPWVYVAA